MAWGAVGLSWALQDSTLHTRLAPLDTDHPWSSFISVAVTKALSTERLREGQVPLGHDSRWTWIILGTVTAVEA